MEKHFGLLLLIEDYSRINLVFSVLRTISVLTKPNKAFSSKGSRYIM